MQYFRHKSDLHNIANGFSFDKTTIKRKSTVTFLRLYDAVNRCITDNRNSSFFRFYYKYFLLRFLIPKLLIKQAKEGIWSHFNKWHFEVVGEFGKLFSQFGHPLIRTMWTEKQLLLIYTGPKESVYTSSQRESVYEFTFVQKCTKIRTNIYLPYNSYRHKK